MNNSVDVTQSRFGSFVPQYLLKFKGNVSLQNYFRFFFFKPHKDNICRQGHTLCTVLYILVLKTKQLESCLPWRCGYTDEQILKTNYEKGIVQLGFGHCQVCCSTLTYNDRPRMKSSQPMTKKVSKILARSSQKPLGKYHAYLAQKFLKSSTQLTVRCPSCDTVNKRTIMTNEAKLALKDKLLKMSETILEPDVSEVTKKKRKKKKKKKQRDDNSGLLIPGSINNHKNSDAEETVSLSMDVSSLTPLLPGRFSTPLPSTGQISNLTAFASAKTPNRLVSAPTHFQKGAFSTPVNRNQHSSVSNKRQTASLTKGGKVQPAVHGSKKMKNKHLQEFLSQQSAAVTKPASLADFLSSL